MREDEHVGVVEVSADRLLEVVELRFGAFAESWGE
jgi:hypothetical protein